MGLGVTATADTKAGPAEDIRIVIEEGRVEAYDEGEHIREGDTLERVDGMTCNLLR